MGRSGTCAVAEACSVDQVLVIALRIKPLKLRMSAGEAVEGRPTRRPISGTRVLQQPLLRAAYHADITHLLWALPWCTLTKPVSSISNGTPKASTSLTPAEPLV